MTVKKLIELLSANANLEDKIMIVDKNGEVKDFSINDFSKYGDEIFLELEEN